MKSWMNGKDLRMQESCVLSFVYEGCARARASGVSSARAEMRFFA
jgi:hypothetical protein